MKSNQIIKPLAAKMLVVLLGVSPASLAQTSLPQVPDIRPPEEPQDKQIPEFETVPEVPIEVVPPRVPENELTLPYTLTVKQFSVRGNSVVSTEDIQAVLQPYLDRPLSNEALREVESTVTKLYFDRGFITSFAYLRLSDNSELDFSGASLVLSVAEGTIEQINVSSKKLQNYVRRRLKSEIDGVVQEDKLQESLIFLLNDPRIDTISVTLNPASKYGLAVLNADVSLKNPISLTVGLNNNRSPSVGSFERLAQFQHLNLIGFGDTFRLGYRNTEGSDVLTVDFAVPLNPQDGTLEFGYQFVTSSIIEEPFDVVDIEGRSDVVQATYRQPIIRDANNRKIEQFALGGTISYENSTLTSPFIPFGISRGSDASGRTENAEISFFQEWSKRENNSALGLRSQFSLGFGLNTPDDPEFSNDAYFKWEAGARWSRNLPSGLVFVARTDLQLSPNSLIPSEQFSIGGPSTVRAFRQNSILSDNGILGNIALEIPLYSGKAGDLVIYPFFDAGTTWNNSESLIGSPNTLASLGLGLRYQISDRLQAKAEVGIPLINGPERRNSLQEQGVHLSVNWRPF